VDQLKAAGSGGDLLKAVKDAAQASRLGAEQTVDMLAVHGRAAIKGQNSRE
jgi:hypothetical protein